jgi:putative transposase
MTQPREIIQGATYFLTRRVLHRRFLLRPDATMTQFILYSLAVAADRYKIQINTFCAMSTHIHMVVTDPTGVLPRFLRCFHHLIAMGAKVLRRWKGSVWDNARTSVVRLLTPEAIIEKIAYTLANPVAARAVQHAHQWPGAKNLVTEIGGDSRQVSRPHIYFNSKSPKWPKEATILVKLPPMIADAKKLQREIGERIAKEEKRAHKKLPRPSNTKKHRASNISAYKRSTSKETQYTRNSTIAVGQGNEDVYEAAIAALRSFRAAYRKALARWRDGERGVAFPKGTWWMREFHAATVNESNVHIPNTTIPEIQPHTES